MKVLHITSWYPSLDNPKEALFIERHISSLEANNLNDQKVIHLSVNPGKFRIRREHSFNANHLIVKIPIRKWLFIEAITFILLSISLIRARVNSFDVINFHVAYPNLTFWHWIKRWIRPKIVITEHWSAYHFNFGLKKPPPRIKRIFHQNLPVIAVSKALLEDIKLFSNADFPCYLVPNIVDTRIFKIDKTVKRRPLRLLMAAYWKEPKDPFVTITAFQAFLIDHPNAKLIIGGFGPLQKEMQAFVDELHLEKSVEFIGKLDSTRIALEMQQAAGFLHCSKYETFSVVCAEALACGCPVIASNVGGIPEFVNESNGILIEEHSEQVLAQAMRKLVSSSWSVEMHDNFSFKAVGEKYQMVLDEVKG